MKNIPFVPREPTEDEVQHQAFLLWQEGGCRDGTALENWHAAQEFLRHHHGRSPRRAKRPPAKTVLIVNR